MKIYKGIGKKLTEITDARYVPKTIRIDCINNSITLSIEGYAPEDQSPGEVKIDTNKPFKKLKPIVFTNEDLVNNIIDLVTSEKEVSNNSVELDIKSLSTVTEKVIDINNVKENSKTESTIIEDPIGK